MSQQVNDRLETLESRLAYAEYTVEQLNEEVTTQGRELDRLKHQIQLLVDKLQSVQPSQIASMAVWSMALVYHQISAPLELKMLLTKLSCR